MTNKIASYTFLSILQVIWAVLLWWMIDEPDVKDEKETRHHEKKSFCGKLFSMLKMLFKACKEDPALLITLIGLIPSRNTVNLSSVNF